MIWDNDNYWKTSAGSTLEGFNNGLTIFCELDEIFNKISVSCKISLKTRIISNFLKNIENQCLECSDPSDMFGDGKSMSKWYFQDVGMIGKILKLNFFWKIFMLFFIKVFSCYFPLRAFSSWKINFSEKSFGAMQNLTEVCWTKMGSKNTFSLSFWALERYFKK